jgi:hypothetical protein
VVDFVSRERGYHDGDILLNFVWFMLVSPESTEVIMLIYRGLYHSRFCIKGIMTVKSEVWRFLKGLVRVVWR